MGLYSEVVLVCMYVRNGFTTEVYSRLRFRSKIPSRMFCVSLRTPRRGGKFEQYRFSYRYAS